MRSTSVSPVYLSYKCYNWQSPIQGNTPMTQWGGGSLDLVWVVEFTTELYTIPVRTGGIFYFPGWQRHQIEGTDSFQWLLRKTLGLANWAKRNFAKNSEAKFKLPQRDSSPVASPSHRSKPLGHHAPNVSEKIRVGPNF